MSGKKEIMEKKFQDDNNIYKDMQYQIYNVQKHGCRKYQMAFELLKNNALGGRLSVRVDSKWFFSSIDT